MNQSNQMVLVEGRVPPHDLDAEAAVISACMLSQAALDEVADILRPEHFYSEAHRRIYEAALELRTVGIVADVVTIGTHLKNRQRIAQVGGMSYLTELLNAAPAVSNLRVRAYAETVILKARVRALIAASQRIFAEGYLDHGADAEYIARSEQAVLAVTGSQLEESHTTHISESIADVYQSVVDAYERGKPNGIATGFFEVDDLLAGLHRKEVMLLAARPGMGKTAFMLSLCHNVARTVPDLFGDDGKPAQPQGVAIFSVEMPTHQLGLRLLASTAPTRLQGLRGGNVADSDWSRIATAAQTLAALPIIIDDTPALHYVALHAKLRRIRRQFEQRGDRLTLVAIDYLQIMSGDGPHIRGREQEISTISRSLTHIAKQEDVAILACAQLSRDVEKRGAGSRRPGLSDLRESGSLEQDANTVGFLYRPEYYGESVTPEEEGLTEVIIAKQRNGPTGTARVRYRGSFTRFENM